MYIYIEMKFNILLYKTLLQHSSRLFNDKYFTTEQIKDTATHEDHLSMDHLSRFTSFGLSSSDDNDMENKILFGVIFLRDLYQRKSTSRLLYPGNKDKDILGL